MKKLLKSLFLKIKAKSTLKIYQKPLIVTIFKLLFINLIVLLIVAIIALTIDNNGKYFGGNFFKAFITAVKWMISVNSINNYDDNDDLKIMILAVAVIAIGMILFSGAIIATLTAASFATSFTFVLTLNFISLIVKEILARVTSFNTVFAKLPPGTAEIPKLTRLILPSQAS